MAASLCVLTTLAASSGVPSFADPLPTNVTIRVLDDISKTPVARAGVRLISDAREYDGLTDSSGTSRFEHVVPGLYGVFVQQLDYAFADTRSLTVVAAGTSLITVLGTRIRTQRIGGTQARLQSQPNPATAAAASGASAELSGSVGTALRNSPAVGLDTHSTSLLIHGENASTTTATINGAPIFPGGAKLPGSLFVGDVFSSASVGGGSLGAPDGTLNFSTYEPVIDWEGLAQGRIDGLGATADSVMERGTAGRLGVSVVHAEQTDVAPFNDQIFTDTSGEAYLHDTSQQSLADVVSMRYGFDVNNTGHLDVGSLRSSTALYCDYMTGPVPCGYGPGNSSHRATQYIQLRDELTLSRISVGVNAFASKSQDTIDFSHQLVEGQPVGDSSQSAVRRVGGTVTVNFALSEQRAASFVASSVAESAYGSGTPTALNPPPARRSSRSAYSLKLPVARSRRFQGSLSAGQNDAYGFGAFTYAANADYSLTATDSLSASLSGGQLGSEPYAFNGVDPPQLLQVDCASGRALGNGPTLQAAPAKTKQVAVNYARRTSAWQANVRAFRNVAAGGMATVALPASTMALNLDQQYLESANAVASQECDAPFSFDMHDLYFGVTAPVSRLATDGLDAGTTFDITPRASVGAGYSFSVQRAFGESLLFAPGSPVFPGATLPGSPSSKLALTGRYAASRATTLIAAVTSFGANNPYLGRSFVDVDAGVRSRFGPGDVVLSILNVTNANNRAFQIFDPFPTLTRAYQPRAIAVRVRIGLGRENIDRAEFLSKPASLGPSLAAFMPSDYEPPPARGWLAPATDSTLCGPEQRTIAVRYLDAIASYDERVRTTASAASGPPPEHFGDVTLSVIRASNTSAIRIEFARKGRSSFAAFLRCSNIHEGSYDQARVLGLYIPSWQQREDDGAYAMYYAPSVGIYTAPDAVNQTAGPDLPPTTLPTRTPPAPFAIAPSCPQSMAAAAAEAASRLKAYIDQFEQGGRPFPPAGFEISRHNAAAETWLEIRPDDRPVSEALAQCLAIPTVSSKSISQRGLGGAFPPSINYAPSVGFYNRAQ